MGTKRKPKTEKKEPRTVSLRSFLIVLFLMVFFALAWAAWFFMFARESSLSVGDAKSVHEFRIEQVEKKVSSDSLILATSFPTDSSDIKIRMNANISKKEKSEMVILAYDAGWPGFNQDIYRIFGFLYDLFFSDENRQTLANELIELEGEKK